MIKKIMTTICALVMCVFCLTGCSWLELDNAKYYNKIVVSIEDTKNFVKKDLVDAFSNYGYQYYSQYQLSMEDSVKKTIESMIDRYLLMEVVKDEITLTSDEKLQIKKEAFNYMEDSIKTYEDKIKEEWGIEVKVETPEEESSLRDAKTEYTPTTEYVDGRVIRVDSHSEDHTGHDHAVVEEDDELLIEEGFDKVAHFTKDYCIKTDTKVFNEAWTRYIKALQDSAKSEGRSTKEEDVLLHEEQRLIELLSNNKYLEKYEEEFFERTPVDVASVLENFRDNYYNQKDLYENNESLYHTAMQNASKDYVYYHPNSGNEYVNVKHILINFNDYQKEEITTLNKRYGISDVYSIDNIKNESKKAEYQKELDKIVNQTTTTIDRDLLDDTLSGSGVIAGFTGDTAYASDVYNLVLNYVTGNTHETKATKFDNLIYIFNDDPGIMNSEFDYVVNLDTEVTDQMVKSFADGVRALDTSNGGNGKGSISKVVTEYGIHILFHDGNVSNIASESVINDDEALLSVLCNTMTTPNSNKSIFNYLYDKWTLDDGLYDTMTQSVVATERSKLKANGLKIVYYENRYEDLWK